MDMCSCQWKNYANTDGGGAASADSDVAASATVTYDDTNIVVMYI